MDQVEHIARTVAQQGTGDESKWQEFVTTVQEAMKLAADTPNTTARDFLDDPTFKPASAPSDPAS